MRAPRTVDIAWKASELSNQLLAESCRRRMPSTVLTEWLISECIEDRKSGGCSKLAYIPIFPRALPFGLYASRAARLLVPERLLMRVPRNRASSIFLGSFPFQIPCGRKSMELWSVSTCVWR